MTEEALEKAMKEGTWLACTTWGDCCLVRVIRVSKQSGDYGDIAGSVRTVKVVRCIDNAFWWAYRSALRIATPNDMLKYGE